MQKKHTWVTIANIINIFQFLQLSSILTDNVACVMMEDLGSKRINLMRSEWEPDATDHY